MNINWLVRFKSKTFCIAFVSGVLLLIQVILKAFGFELDITFMETNIINIINAVFSLLVLLGIVVDPTTKGISDSEQALTYTQPK